MKTLVVVPNWIGDALMAQPLLTLLKRADPTQTLVALAPRWVAPVLAAMLEVDEVIPTDLGHGKLQWAERRALVETVRARGFDRAFVLPNSLKSALIPWFARIPRRIGYRGEMRVGLVNVRADGPDTALSMTARYAALAGLVDVDVTPPLPLPRLAVDAARSASARRRFDLGAAPLIAFCPGAEYGPAKRWPADHFAELARTTLASRRDVTIVLLGGKGDRAISEEIVARAGRSPRLVDLAGATDLGEAIALIAACEHVVSNDSGLMHVAAALGRPQTALFGSSDPRHTPPLSPLAQVLWLHLDCSPCFERTCPLGHLNCLVGIAPQRVVDAMNESRNEVPRDSMQNTSPSHP